MKDAGKHTEETKIVVPHKDVTISKDGHVSINNPRLVEKLKASKVVGGSRGEEAAVSVGVVVGESF